METQLAVKEASRTTTQKKIYQHLLEPSVGNVKFRVEPSFDKAIRLPLPLSIALLIIIQIHFPSQITPKIP